MKKIIAAILCVSAIMSLSGCESKDIKEAKELVDDIYELTNDITEAQLELSGDSSDMFLRQTIAIDESMLEAFTSSLLNIYEGLSDKGKQEVYDYVTEAGYKNIINIWS